MYATAPLSYSQWLNTLDALVRTTTGLSLYQLPDFPYATAFERDLSPEDFLDTYVAEHLERYGA